MHIKKVVFLFMITLLVSSCGENSRNSYNEFGSAYLIGKDINLFPKMPATYGEAPKPSLIIDASEPLQVIVLGKEEDPDGSAFKTGLVTGKKWIRIRYSNEEELIEGFVDYSNVYSDKGAKILFAIDIDDDADDRNKISPKNYSTSTEIDLARQYTKHDKYSNPISKKACDLYDAALLLSSISSLKKGEYETQQEFSDRKEALRNLSFSTGATEKIYAYSGSVSSEDFNYDVETETMTYYPFAVGGVHICPEDRYCSKYDNTWKTLSTLAGLSLSWTRELTSEVTAIDCPIYGWISFKLEGKTVDLGPFETEFKGGNFVVVEEFKIDRVAAQQLKETRGLEYRYLVGLSIDGEIFEGSQWTKRNCYGGDTYPYEEQCYNTQQGKFDFSSAIEYLITFDEKGNVVKSYFTNNYLDNYLQNDLLIQMNAYPNQSLLEEIDSLDEKEQIAKLFFNRIGKTDTPQEITYTFEE